MRRKLKFSLATATALLLMINFAPKDAKAASVTDSKSATVSFTVDPTITLAVSTSSISFGNVSPIDAQKDLLSALNLTIQSNAQYKVTAVASDDFVGTSNPANRLAVNNLKLKLNSDPTWLTMDKVTPVDIVTGQAATSSAVHAIDFRLLVPWVNAVPDTYTTTVTFSAVQM